MSPYDELIGELHAAVAAGSTPAIEHIVKKLEPLAIGLRQKIPVVSAGARLFRVRKMEAMPLTVVEVGAPPLGVAPIGRLNEAGRSILYLADSPDTAFSEARATAGRYCLSEWWVQQPKVALANGGIHIDLLRAHFPSDLDPPGAVMPAGREDEQVLALFGELFTLPATQNSNLYRWSIACGLANGFAALCGRTVTETVDGNTMFNGRYPLAGIAYPSVRKDKQAINFAFNDLGTTYLRLHNVQWVEKQSDGFFSGIDISSSWAADGRLLWQGRPAHYQLQSGESARLVKVAENVWHYEPLNGDIPLFA